MEQFVVLAMWLVAVGIGVPLLVVGTQCLIALVPARAQRLVTRQPVAILIPAHNEESVLGKTLDNIRSQLLPNDRVVVVADNCVDATAQLALSHGVEVVERFDDVQRGKGFALDAGVRYLSQSPPGLVIVLDADCVMTDNSVDALASQVAATSRPAQAVYLMQLPTTRSPEAAVSVFAFLVKNWVRPRAMQRLGLPVLLTGSGMAFPWCAISEVPLASGEIVEDLVLGLTLTQRGFGPQLCETAFVLSELPNDPKAAVSQRTRWEHGYLNTILNYVPKLCILSVMRLNPRLALVALDLVVPPLSLLVMLAALSLAVLGFAAFAFQQFSPFCLCLAAVIQFMVGISLAWFVFGRAFVPSSRLLQIPSYVVNKAGLYFHFLVRRQTEWVKTDRK